jgi:uncharacterized membrane protein
VKWRYIAGLALLALVSACGMLSPDRQSVVDEIAKARLEFETKLAESTADWQQARVEEAQIRAELKSAQDAGNDELIDALSEALGNVTVNLAQLSGKQDALAASVDALDETEASIRAEDAGEKTSALLELLVAVSGGGAAAGALQKLMPSRSKGAIEAAMNEVNKIQTAMAAYEAQNGVLTDDSKRLREELAKVQGQVEAFMRGAGGGRDVTS